MDFVSRPVSAVRFGRRFLWPVVTAGLVALLVGLVYSNSVTRSFHADDPITVFAGPTVKSVSQVPRFLSDSRYFQRSPDGPLYRPLVQTTYAIDHAISGEFGTSYHVTNLLLHGLATALFGWFLLRVLDRSWPTVDPRFTAACAIAGAALFAVHPLNSEAVNYVSARSSLLAGAALMGSLLVYLREEGPGVRSGPLAGALALFLAALLSREAAVVFPVALVLFDVAFRRGTFRRRLVPWMTFAFVAVAYLGVRKAVLGTTGIDLSASLWSGGPDPYLASERGIGTHFLTSLKVYFMAASLFVAPVSLSVSRDVSFVQSIFQGEALLSFFGLLVVAAGAIYALRRMPVVTLGATWFLLFMFPANGIVPVQTVFQEHRSYVPAMGLVLIAAEPARLLFLALARRIGFRGLAVASSLVALAIIVMLAGITHVRNGAWVDNRTLVEDAAAKAPESPRTLHALGVELQRIAKFDDAERTLEKSVELRPHNAQARLALARVKEQNGKEKDAEEILKHLVTDFPRSSLSAFELGLFYQRRGKADLALDAYTRAIQNDPKFADAHLNLGWLLRGMGRNDEALDHLREVLKIEPDHRQATMVRASIEEIKNPKPKKTAPATPPPPDPGDPEKGEGTPSPAPPGDDGAHAPKDGASPVPPEEAETSADDGKPRGDG